MEADWEFEVGGDAPVIDACWLGFVDLQRTPEAAWQLPEAALLAGLAETLIKLNAIGSPVWSSKCDYWPLLEAEAFDLGELDVLPGSANCAVGCYIDLLPKKGVQWAQPEEAAAVCKQVCGQLCAVPLRSCRADLVIRRAFITADLTELGVTAYLTACGNSSDEAKATLQAALSAFSDAFCFNTKVE